MWSAFLVKNARKCQDIFRNILKIMIRTTDLKLAPFPTRSRYPSRLYLLCGCSQQLRSRTTRIKRMIRMTHLRLAVATLTHARTKALQGGTVAAATPQRVDRSHEAPAARYMLAPAATLFVIGPSRTGIFRRSRSTPKAEFPITF
jgi:hypothetical protein